VTTKLMNTPVSTAALAVCATLAAATAGVPSISFTFATNTPCIPNTSALMTPVPSSGGVTPLYSDIRPSLRTDSTTQ